MTVRRRAGELSQVRAVTQRFTLRVVADAFEEDLPALMGSPRTMQTAEAAPFAEGRPSDDSTMADAAMTPDHHVRHPRCCRSAPV